MEPADQSKYDPRIDVVRAVALLLVTVAHFAVPQWTESIPDRHLVLDTVVLGLMYSGWLGVPLFVFVSGYSLGLGKTSPEYTLDKKQFFINRVLRIFPVWVICILSLSFTHKLTGYNAFMLLLLQMQEIPANTPFHLAWVIQLAFICYLFFPILLSAVANRRMVWIYYAFFFLFRLDMYYQPTTFIWDMSYNTVFGEGTIFLTGIYAASLPPLTRGARSRVYFWSGSAAFCLAAVYIWKSGGPFQPVGGGIRSLFRFMPEILSAIFFIALRGWFAKAPASPPADGIFHRSQRVVFRAFTHIGKVSYSGYMFSGFISNFWQPAFSFIQPGGLKALILASISYFLCLWIFATVSYNAIELPFLNMRKKYTRLDPAVLYPDVARQPPARTAEKDTA